MPSTPGLSLPYPSPTDPVAQGAAAIRSLAEAVEKRLLAIRSGTVQGSSGAVLAGVGFTAARTGVGTFTVTFAPAYTTLHAITATVVAQPPASGACIATIRNRSAAGFDVFLSDNTTSGGSPRDYDFAFISTGVLAATSRPAPDDDPDRIELLPGPDLPDRPELQE